ncbi:MAG TPA: arsenite methyltransferase [Anaerolineales bacterium]|nr:arsenite methyltransferase [Anaerolineales bacterium]
MNRPAEDIRQSVRQHYSKVADSVEGNLAAPSPCCGGLYEAEDLSRLPVEAIASSRGCGNPTALAALRPGEAVLDLGSGGGLDAFLAAQRVGPDGYVYGVDATPSMIDLARRNAARAGVDNVEFLPGDLEDLPLPDETVDVILSNCVVNLTPDKTQALREAFRVLRPGGRLAISDIVIDPDLSGFALSPAEIRQAVDWAGCAAGALTRAEWEQSLTEAGFSEIQLEIEYRMNKDDLPHEGSKLVGRLPEDQLGQLANRFTSSAISARRPLE